MTDEKIKEEFDAYLKTPATNEEKDIYAEFIVENQEDKLIYLGYRAGFRTAERLAKIEVLEELRDKSEYKMNAEMYRFFTRKINELKEGGK